MSSLKQRYSRHPTASRFILFIFAGWAVLFTLSNWIDLFQGFEVVQVLSEWVQGMAFGVLVLLLIGFPLWLGLTYLGEKRMSEAENKEEDSPEDSEDMEWPDDL